MANILCYCCIIEKEEQVNVSLPASVPLFLCVVVVVFNCHYTISHSQKLMSYSQTQTSLYQTHMQFTNKNVVIAQSLGAIRENQCSSLEMRQQRIIHVFYWNSFLPIK